MIFGITKSVSQGDPINGWDRGYSVGKHLKTCFKHVLRCSPIECPWFHPFLGSTLGPHLGTLYRGSPQEGPRWSLGGLQGDHKNRWDRGDSVGEHLKTCLKHVLRCSPTESPRSHPFIGSPWDTDFVIPKIIPYRYDFRYNKSYFFEKIIYNQKMFKICLKRYIT